MEKYIVNICRIAYSNLDIEVEAINQVEAERWALDNAGSYDFPIEHTSEYQLNSTTKVK